MYCSLWIIPDQDLSLKPFHVKHGLGHEGSPTCSSLIPDLCPCRWENKDVYAAAIRSLRMRELQTPECMTAVRAGLGSIIPLQLLTTLTPLEMELRTCGLPYINLEFLKVLWPRSCGTQRGGSSRGKVGGENLLFVVQPGHPWGTLAYAWTPLCPQGGLLRFHWIQEIIGWGLCREELRV